MCIYNSSHLRICAFKMKRPERLVPLIYKLDVTSCSLLSKAYASQIITLLPEICENNCAGCIEDQLDHDICDLSLSEKVILLRSELAQSIDEEKITSDIIYFASCLNLDCDLLDEDIFNISLRKDLLKSKSFWIQINCHLLVAPVLLNNKRYELLRAESSHI